MVARIHGCVRCGLASQPIIEPPPSRAGIPGTIRALAVSCFSSPAFRALNARSTQVVYRKIIERLCVEHGDKRVALLHREHVIRMMAARSDKPNSANGLRKVLRSMMLHAVEVGLRTDDPTRDIKALRVKTDGYHSWTEEEISQFEGRQAIGSRARLALAVLLYTGGAATPSEHLTYLTTQFGKSFTAAGFGNWFRDRCNEVGLRHCSAHGLRKAAARRLAEAGCTAHEIAAITGHASLREVQRYTKAVDQRRLGISAMNKMRTVSG